MQTQILTGILFSALISIIAWRANALSASGVVAAFFTGSLIFSLGGLSWAALLLTFFISSSLLSRILVGQKKSLGEKFSKGSRRDWGQVLANGGLGVLLAVAFLLTGRTELPWIAFSGAMAAVNADTWATELGVFSQKPPRLVTTGKIVERGASGGITFLGYLAAFGGATLIAAMAAAIHPFNNPVLMVAAIILAGLGGSTLDSLLGATLQGMYYCPCCQKETERHPTHTCGTATLQIRGWHWINNDWVNFACSVTGACLAISLISIY